MVLESNLFKVCVVSKAFEIGSKLQRDWAAMEEHERETLNKWVKENMKGKTLILFKLKLYD